jgi:hypothetical protein
MAATLSATGFDAIRQHGGNSRGFSVSRAIAAAAAPYRHPFAENKVHGLVTDEIGLLEPYPQ